MVNDVDQNDNGMIEFNEFLQMMSKKMREGDSEDELKEAFKWVHVLLVVVRYVTAKVFRLCIFIQFRLRSPLMGFILMWCFMFAHRNSIMLEKYSIFIFWRLTINNQRPPLNSNPLRWEYAKAS